MTSQYPQPESVEFLRLKVLSRFIISYFQTEIIADLSTSSAGYGILTGYGTSVLSSFTA